MEERYITTVDLGSSKIALSVTRIKEEQAEVIYYCETPSEGIRNSSIFNPAKAATSLKKAVKAACDELGIVINQVVIGLPGNRVEQISASAKIRRTNPGTCIEQSEIDLLKSNAMSDYPITDPEHLEIYGAIPQSFNADDMIGVTEGDVVGMTSETIEGNFKIFLGAKNASSNIDVMLGIAGITASEKCFLPVSTADAVLTKGEMDNGVALVEVGAGITSLTIFQNGLLRHYSSIPFGGNNVTSDIRYQYGLRDNLAENIKLAFGACLPARLQSMSEKIIQINNDEDGSCEQIPVSDLSELIDARMREIFEAVLFNIEESGYADKLRNGIVLTGGGANLTNCQLLLKEMSGYSIRLGFPRNKGITTIGCSGIGETSAAASFGMILRAKRNTRLNCSSPIRPTSVEKPENETEIPVTDLHTIWEETETVKPRRERKARRGLLEKTGNACLNALENTFGGLFDDMK